MLVDEHHRRWRRDRNSLAPTLTLHASSIVAAAFAQTRISTYKGRTSARSTDDDGGSGGESTL